MASASVRFATAPDRQEGPHARGTLLFKSDHPRIIDRYIDYFGGTLGPCQDGDACGESLLEHLT